MKKRSYIFLGLLGLMGAFVFIWNNLDDSKPHVKKLIQEDVISYNAFTVSPDNNWIVYSNGSQGNENIIAFNINYKEKHNLTENSMAGRVLATKLNDPACWSLDSVFCFVGDYYIDFSQSEPRLFPKSNLSSSQEQRSLTCSDCINNLEEYKKNDNCGGFSLLAPNKNLTAKAETCGPLVRKLSLLISDNLNKMKYKVDIPNANSTFMHWTSDSKKLYFTQPNNVISYIEMDN